MDAETHRKINSIMILFMLLALVAIAMNTNHNIDDCEHRLYEKLTGQNVPEVLK